MRAYFSGPLGTNRLFLCLWAGITAGNLIPAINGSTLSAALAGFGFAAFLADSATYLDNKMIEKGRKEIAAMNPDEVHAAVTNYINRKTKGI